MQCEIYGNCQSSLHRYYHAIAHKKLINNSTNGNFLDNTFGIK